MPEELDPIHTQFIFTNNGKRSKNGRETACREAFEHFLLNINIKERGIILMLICNELKQYTYNRREERKRAGVMKNTLVLIHLILLKQLQLQH